MQGLPLPAEPTISATPSMPMRPIKVEPPDDDSLWTAVAGSAPTLGGGGGHPYSQLSAFYSPGGGSAMPGGSGGAGGGIRGDPQILNVTQRGAGLFVAGDFTDYKLSPQNSASVGVAGPDDYQQFMATANDPMLCDYQVTPLQTEAPSPVVNWDGANFSPNPEEMDTGAGR